jgi:hypothetical protein
MQDMTPQQSRSGCGCGLVLFLIAFLIGTLFLLVVAVSSSYDQRISIHDSANVLNDEQVERQNSGLTFNIAIYTVRSYTCAHDRSAFRKYVEDQNHLYNDGLAIGIETSSGTMLVEINANREVEDTFTSTLHSPGEDFTRATIAAVLKLKQVYEPAPPEGWLRELGLGVRSVADRVIGPANTALLFTALAALFFLLIVAILVLYFFGLKTRGVRSRGSFDSR